MFFLRLVFAWNLLITRALYQKGLRLANRNPPCRAGARQGAKTRRSCGLFRGRGQRSFLRQDFVLMPRCWLLPIFRWRGNEVIGTGGGCLATLLFAYFSIVENVLRVFHYHTPPR